jgi:hypothetical protein
MLDRDRDMRWGIQSHYRIHFKKASVWPANHELPTYPREACENDE